MLYQKRGSDICARTDFLKTSATVMLAVVPVTKQE